jgi:hypothetical protein
LDCNWYCLNNLQSSKSVVHFHHLQFSFSSYRSFFVLVSYFSFQKLFIARQNIFTLPNAFVAEGRAYRHLFLCVVSQP